MRYDDFDAWARALPGTEFDVKWGADRTFMVGSKVFVFAGVLGDDHPCLCFKASDLSFEMLVESGACIPAPYLARAKWVRMATPDSLTDDEIRAYVLESRRLVAAKLTRKQRSELGISPDQAGVI